MYDKYGPMPRICIDFVYNPDVFAQYQDLYAGANQGDLLDNYHNIYSKGKMFDLDESSQTMYLLAPEWKAESPLVHHRLEPINRDLKTKFDKQIMEEMSFGRARRLI